MHKWTGICPLKHLKAIILRRLITIKRSWKSILFSIFGTIIACAISVAFYWMMTSWIDPLTNPISYKNFNVDSNIFIIVGNPNNEYVSKIVNIIRTLFEKDTDKQASFIFFNSLNEMGEYVYAHNDMNIIYGLDLSSGPSNVLVLYNDRYYDELYSIVLFDQTLWLDEFNSNKKKDLINTKKIKKTQPSLNEYLISNFSSLQFEFSPLYDNVAKSTFSVFGPFLLVAGLLTCIPLILSQIIFDIKGEVRQYMMQCTLKLFPYWLGTFILDFLIWIIITTIVWALLNLGWIRAFHDNLFNTWYIIVFQGPSMLLFLYCLSFAFSSSISEPRIIYLIMILLCFVGFTVRMIISSDRPLGLQWFWALIPPISLELILSIVIENIGFNKENLNYYWHYRYSMPYLIMQWVDIIIYGLILTIIEMNRISIQRKMAKQNFSNYSEYFRQSKRQFTVTDETREMEENLHNIDDWALKIQKVSRLFMNNEKQPIIAVNNVSLGIKEFSLFGLLGANAAGKTTLINMITGNLPPSSGTIELFGTKIEDIKDQTVISICPQFNNHLFLNLTPREHFKIYSLLYQIDDDDDIDDIIGDLISGMELDDFDDVPVRELSLGDARKLGVALSFFGPSKLLILDEPTASLDPVACRCVQEMILEHKGEKTFILCTHILSEAEFMCDEISIMVKGNIYTIGSPQYLTEKFGKEYRIDIELDNASKECHRKVEAFFNHQLPSAKFEVQRPKSRIYSISDSVLPLADLFKIMQDGQDGDNGFNYFTCSSSSLEKVFLENIRRSNYNHLVESSFEENYYESDLQDFPTSCNLRDVLRTSNSNYRLILDNDLPNNNKKV